MIDLNDPDGTLYEYYDELDKIRDEPFMIKHWEFLNFWDAGWKDVQECLQTIENDDEEVVLPLEQYRFRALELTKPEEVRCVILGQDPYPTKGHADGLAFSVQPHVRPIPRSLRNIFTEYKADLGLQQPKTGSLESWASNGVLLLNTLLTVEEGHPLSHANLGWENLTEEILIWLRQNTNCVFLLWGSKAKDTYPFNFDERVIYSAHPSPLSATKGFFGSKPFSRVNERLTRLGEKEIQWRLP